MSHELRVCGVEPVVSAMRMAFVLVALVTMAVCHTTMSVLHMVHVKHTLPVSH